jgi:hypothetical protein
MATPAHGAESSAKPVQSLAVDSVNAAEYRTSIEVATAAYRTVHPTDISFRMTAKPPPANTKNTKPGSPYNKYGMTEEEYLPEKKRVTCSVSRIASHKSNEAME